MTKMILIYIQIYFNKNQQNASVKCKKIDNDIIIFNVMYSNKI